MKSCSKCVNKPFVWRRASGCGCVYFRMCNFGITTIHIRGMLVVTAWPEMDCQLLATPDLWTMKGTMFGHKKSQYIYIYTYTKFLTVRTTVNFFQFCYWCNFRNNFYNIYCTFIYWDPTNMVDILKSSSKELVLLKIFVSYSNVIEVCTKLFLWQFFITGSGNWLVLNGQQPNARTRDDLTGDA